MAWKKRLSGISIATVCLLVVSGCTSNGGGGEGEDVPEAVDLQGQTVASLFTSLNNDYYSSWDEGARAAVEAFNGNYVGLTNEGDPATQISQFQQQVDAGVEIIFVTAPDPSSVPEMARIANENDVCFANTWEMAPWESPFDYGDNYTMFLSADTDRGAYETAVALFEEMGGEGNFVHVTGWPGAIPDSQRTEAIDRALQDYPDITLIERQPGEWDRDSSRNAMAGIINRVGAENIDGVFGQNDDVAIGAMNALQEAGRTDVPVVGVDGNQGTMELIAAGDIFASYSNLPQWQAGFSFIQALDACVTGEAPEPLNRQLMTDGMLVTADNVDHYLETYASGDSPYNWIQMSRVAYPDDWDPQNGVRVLDMEEFWAYDSPAEENEFPQEYEDALSDMDAVNDEWDAHWQLLRDGR